LFCFVCFVNKNADTPFKGLIPRDPLDVLVNAGEDPVVAALPSSASNTDFVIAAQGTDASGSGIYADVYTTSGTIGITIPANADFVTGNQTHPAITSFPTGFAVVWQGPEVYCAIFNA